MITQDNELVTHIWNNMNPNTHVDIGMEVYLAKTDVKRFHQCIQNLKNRKDWMDLQTMPNSSMNLAIIGSKFSDTDNVRRAVSCHHFFYHNRTTLSFLFFLSLVIVITNVNVFAKAGLIFFSLLWACMNSEFDIRVNDRIRQSGLLKVVESYVQPEQYQLQNGPGF